MRFVRITAQTFPRLEERLRARGAHLTGIVADTVAQTRASWPQCSALLDDNRALHDAVQDSIEAHSRILLR